MTGISTRRILVLTLASGEDELAECRRSVGGQLGVSTEQVLFEDMANAEAHAALYRTITERTAGADLFLKLDADMVLADESALRRMAAYFDRDPELDHLVMGVEDWFTSTTIIGVHMFSSRARWRSDSSGLFTDPDPVFPGHKLVIDRPDPVVVHHAPDPSPLQAFFFGVHRGLKACQWGFPWRDRQLFGARTSWAALEALWRHAQRNDDRRLGLALWGADLALRRTLPPTAVNRGDSALREAFVETESLTRGDIDARLRPRWASRWRRRLGWMRGMGPAMTLLVLGRGLRDAVTAPVRAMLRARQPAVAAADPASQRSDANSP